MSMVFCRGCAKEIHESALACPHCGAQQSANKSVINIGGHSEAEQRILPVFLLCLFFGVFGVHRFYVGKVGSGIIQLLTLGGFGIWSLVDLVFIICGLFTNSKGKKIDCWL